MKWFSNNLKYLIEKSGKSREEIANELGFPGHSRISNYLHGHSSPRSNDLMAIAKYFKVSVDDLTGTDLKKHKTQVEEPQTSYSTKNAPLPLIPIDAMAGYSNGDSPEHILEAERYIIPEFRNKADFLIRVSGTSMSPKYFNGDIVACRKIPTQSFLQWGKVYIMDTIQGALCKRVFPSKKEGHIICHSDNSEAYPDFEISWKEVRSLAIVVGVVRLE